MPLSQIKITYEHDQGHRMEEDFEWMDEKALGAASLAQVHKAKLKGSGDIVAVKM